MISTSLGCDVSPYLLAACPLILMNQDITVILSNDTRM